MENHYCIECHRAGLILYDCCNNKASDIVCRANAALLAPTIDDAIKAFEEKRRPEGYDPETRLIRKEKDDEQTT